MSRRIRRLDLASEAVLVALIVGTPLAFGSVEIWATETMKAAIVLFALLRIVRAWLVRREGSSVAFIRGTGLALPAALFIGLAALQVLPLPASAIRLVSPKADALYLATLPGYPSHPAFSGTEPELLSDPAAAPFSVAGPGIVAPRPRMRTLSVFPEGTFEQIYLLITYLLLFFSAVEYTRDIRRRIRFLMAVTLTGFAIAAFAVVQDLTWNGKIFWLRDAPPHTLPFGPFINPNNFAGYMELVLPVSVGLLLSVWRVRRRGPEPVLPVVADATVISFPRLETPRLPLFSQWGDAALSKTAVFACAMVVALISIVRCGSQGGLIATFVTFALFAGLLVPKKARRPVAIAGVSLVAVLSAASGLGLAGRGPLAGPLSRLSDVGQAPSFAMRWITWKEILPLVRDYPAVGTGLGTFNQAFRAYYPAGNFGIWNKAHNDYLQLLAEAGIPGALLLLAGLASFSRRVVLPACQDWPGREIRLGLAMALVSMAIHSLVEFNLQIPSNGMLTVLIGSALSGAVLAGEKEEQALWEEAA